MAAATLSNVETVVTAVVGAAGLPQRLPQRKLEKLAIANKEPLVIAGALIMRLAKENGGSVIPIDSEHAALHQCLSCGKPAQEMTITASGGALRDFDDLSAVTLTKPCSTQPGQWVRK